MKNLPLILVLFCATCGWAQTLPTVQPDGLVTYTEAVTVANTTKGELMERAKNWLMGSKHSISFISEEMGMISVGSSVPHTSGSPETNGSVSGRVVYVATILVQEGLFMYEFNNFFHEADPSLPHATDLGFVMATGLTNKDLNRDWKVRAMDDVRAKLDASVQKTIGSLKKAMQNENPSLSWNVNGK